MAEGLALLPGQADGQFDGQQTLTRVLSAAFLATALVFVWRSFYRMRIGQTTDRADSRLAA